MLDLTEHELLATHDIVEHLVADGRVCHGGFDAGGNYVSPRTLHRVPAIEAWGDHHTTTFGADLVDIGIDEFPGHTPNVEQAKLLIGSGTPEPIISILTRIGTVEGFGAFLRHVPVPTLQPLFSESIDGTALAHLDRGLIEAHARDEAGFEDVAGHREMWFAARDIAFERPVTEDQTAIMLERMGIGAASGGTAAPALVRRWPDDTPVELEFLVDRLIRLVLIEISAFHTFAWAEAVLSDDDLVAGNGEAARLVSHIRADEAPHVGYLRVALTELRDRTVIGASGRRHAGADLLAALWDPAVADQRGPRRSELESLVDREVRHAMAGRSDEADLYAEFIALGAPVGEDAA